MRLHPHVFGPLAPHLLDLAAAFQSRGLPLVLVGGFGLVLRRQWRQEQGEATLIEAVPPARATEDFDVLLTLNLLADEEPRQAIRAALQDLKYAPVEGMEYLHFTKLESGHPGRPIKVDFLAPPAPPEASEVKEKHFRVGARRSGKADKLHGYRTPEAELMHGPALTIPIEGTGTAGGALTAEVTLPHAFVLIQMKLRAFRDEVTGVKSAEVPRTALADKHLLDAYTLVALLTQREADEVLHLARSHAAHPVVEDVRGIVRDWLSTPSSPGSLQLLGALHHRPDHTDLTAFLDLLTDAYLPEAPVG